MKCKELIKLLQQHDENEEIVIAVDYMCGIPQRIVTVEEYLDVPSLKNLPCEFRHVLLCDSQRTERIEKKESSNECLPQIIDFDKLSHDHKKAIANAIAEAYFREQERKQMRPNLSRRERP